jgi:hypothetical protein
MRAVAAVMMAAMAIAGCARGEDEARRDRLALERGRLEAQLDVLEARLVVGQARVRLWRELRARHGEVSQVACQNATWHAADMARAAEDDRQLARAARAPRLAAVAAPRGAADGGEQ